MDTNRDTLIINLYGAPSSGKSTVASYIFSQLKMRGVSCELVTEYAKDLVWEERDLTFLNEIYIFAKQHQRLFRVNGKVDVIVTDRPLILSAFYNTRYGSGRFNELNPLVLEQYHSHNNFDVFLNRSHKYEVTGRNEDEQEAEQIEKDMKDFMRTTIPSIHEIDGTDIKKIDNVINYVIGAIK